MTGVAATAAFAASAGVATFFAPCAFPLLPGYVGFFLREHDDPTTAEVVLAAAAAATGAVLALGAVGAGAYLIGRPLTDRVVYVEPLAGVVLLVFGAAVAAGRGPGVRLPLPARPSSVGGVAVFGAGYALAAAGCVVPLLLGVVTQALTLSPAGSGVVLATYAAAVAAPLVGVTLLAAAGVDAWRSLGRVGSRVERVAGVVMLLAGAGQLALSARLLGWV